MQSAKTGDGLASGVVPCLTGNMVYSLIKLGYLEDSRVQGAINWITAYQRADDGIEQEPEGDIYKRYEICWGRHSCHMGIFADLSIQDPRPQNAVNIESDSGKKVFNGEQIH